jgi:hypothetical protein
MRKNELLLWFCYFNCWLREWLEYSWVGYMRVEEYRNDVTAKLVKLEERQVSIFKTLQRVEKHLDKLNGQVEENKTNLTKIGTVGSIGILTVPIIVSIIMRLV